MSSKTAYLTEGTPDDLAYIKALLSQVVTLVDPFAERLLASAKEAGLPPTHQPSKSEVIAQVIINLGFNYVNERIASYAEHVLTSPLTKDWTPEQRAEEFQSFATKIIRTLQVQQQVMEGECEKMWDALIDRGIHMQLCDNCGQQMREQMEKRKTTVN